MTCVLGMAQRVGVVLARVGCSREEGKGWMESGGLVKSGGGLGGQWVGSWLDGGRLCRWANDVWDNG